MKLWLRVHGYEPCSWTFVWHNLCHTFREMGDELYDLMAPDDALDCIEIWWGDPQFWNWSGLDVKLRVAIALSEARSLLASGRDNAIRNMARADLIVCPSLSATQAFKELPLDAPIVVVPFGVDIDEFPWVERDWTGQLSFLHAGITQFRKGSWMVPEAFVAAFAEDVGGVRLTIASPRASPMFVQLKAEYGNHRSIDFKLGLEESASTIYNAHHIYVTPHLSEGFGLMIPEAMATGMPAIVARCSAPREFFSPDYGWWIEMSEDYVRVCECLPETSGFWRLPDLDSLVAVM
ncbi:MAG: glycosyltransferase, partial [Planctomycetota bacterium]